MCSWRSCIERGAERMSYREFRAGLLLTMTVCIGLGLRPARVRFLIVDIFG